MEVVPPVSTLDGGYGGPGLFTVYRNVPVSSPFSFPGVVFCTVVYEGVI